MEQKSNRREFTHTKELSGDGRASEQLTLAEIRELKASTTLTWPAAIPLFRWLWLRPRLTSLLSIGHVVCSPLATCPSPVLWAYAPTTITEFNIVHKSRWYSNIFGRMHLFQHPPIHNTCGHGDISAIILLVLSPTGCSCLNIHRYTVPVGMMTFRWSHQSYQSICQCKIQLCIFRWPVMGRDCVGELGLQYGTRLKSHGAVTNWCTGRGWPVNCMTVISARGRSNMPFQRLWKLHIPLASYGKRLRRRGGVTISLPESLMVI